MNRETRALHLGGDAHLQPTGANAKVATSGLFHGGVLGVAHQHYGRIFVGKQVVHILDKILSNLKFFKKFIASDTLDDGQIKLGTCWTHPD